MKETNVAIAIKATIISIIGNFVLALAKGFAGFFGNSYALIADAIESTTDLFASILVLFGIKYAARPADSNHPYGHGRVEALITFAVVGFLLISATLIAYESILNILTPHSIPEKWTLIVLGVIIVYKEIAFRYTYRKGVQTNSSALKADAWHHRSDAITSLAAFLGISISLFMGPGYESADDWAALFASFFIVYNAYKIFRPALGEILDEHLYADIVDQIRIYSTDVNGVIGTEKCNVRKTGLTYLVDLHLIVDGGLSVKDGHEIAHRLKDYLMEQMPQIADVLIHVEPDSF